MKSFTKSLALLGCFAAGLCTQATAQDSGALLDALVRKGVLSDQEAEDIRADLTRDYAMTNINAVPGSRNVTRLAISGRIQAQFDNLSTDNEVGADPSATSHFFLRRVYLGARASFGPNWTGNLVYDFSGSRFDAAVIDYAVNSDLTIGAGLRKVDFGYEERTSSTRLKAIERSGITRYFVEDNNGRRLGAGAHRIGVFANGKVEDFFYGAAITNPERVVSGSAVSSNNAGANNASSTGGSGNNNFAFWANAGYKSKSTVKVPFTTGFGLGYLPDQGGRAASGGAVVPGEDMWVGSYYADVTFGKFGLSAEYFYSQVDNGNNRDTLAGNADVNPSGYYIQPTYSINDRLELVARYSYTDTDGRGIAVSDGIRNASSTISNYDTLTDYYFGVNYYFKGSDVKFSAGYVYGKGEDRLSGSANESEVSGIRSQIQVVF
jgi:polyhydroxyalkanoate synthesis regulator phasin